MADTTSIPHKLTLSEGSKLTVTGVTEVRELLPHSALLSTPLGDLLVQGKDLELKTLTPEDGQLILTGTVTDIGYLRSRPKKSFWGRLLG